MPQFFLSPESVREKTFHLRGPEAFHITKVLRYREGQPLTVFDGHGGRYEAVIDKILADGSLTGTVVKTLHEKDTRLPVALNLYQGLLKSASWEWVLQKGTELGVSSFTPVLTPRTVVLLRGDSPRHAKKERWQRVLMSACKQSGAGRLPALKEPAEFRSAIKVCSEPGLTLLAWEGMSQATAGESLRQALREAEQKRGPQGLTVNLFVGPEGGFSEEEVELAESLGAVVFGLGSRILRAETAAMAASTLVLYELGSL